MPLCIIAAAGPGMGAAIARRFAREGFDLALIARDAARLEAMASELRAMRVTVTTHSADLSAPDTLVSVFTEIAAEHGPAQVLVYNGARSSAGPAIALAPAEFHKDLALCATGALACAQQVYPGMRAAGAGTILFTGGGLALFPQAGGGGGLADGRKVGSAGSDLCYGRGTGGRRHTPSHRHDRRNGFWRLGHLRA